MQSNALYQQYGLKGIGRKELEWHAGYDPYFGAVQAYQTIGAQLSALVRVEPAWAAAEAGRVTLESY